MSQAIAGLSEAEEIGQITARIRSRLDRTARDIVEIGKDLIRAKELLPHGQFADWLSRQFELSHRSANQFMAAARRFGPELEAVASLPSGVMLELSSPSVPEGLVEAVLDGRVPASVGAVREQLSRHRARRGGQRAARELGELLWSLPDDPRSAARSLTNALLREADSDESFLPWAHATLVGTLELLDGLPS